MTVFGYDISRSSPRPERRHFSFANWFQRRKQSGDLQRYDKSEYGIWSETVNPLQGLTADKAADTFDQARRGIYADLQWLYQELEAADPTLFTVAERREAAVEQADWRVVLCNPDRTTGFDEVLANEQQDYLSKAYGMAGDEMSALTAHLERGFFRGFAHARPIYTADMQGVEKFELYDQWNFARDIETGLWWWNPDASGIYTQNFKPIPPAELITLTRTRHIDYPMLDIAVRMAIGEKKYASWLERYGIPPVTIIMPEFADKAEEDAYKEAAQSMALAGSGALPFGSQVNYANEARGTNPFTEHLKHNQELTVLMGTGGLLTTLTAPDSGTLAGNAHSDTWRSVVARDMVAAARAVNRRCSEDLLNAAFAGQPHLAMIEIDNAPAPAPGQVLEDAGKAKAAGYLIDRADLEERTGYKLEIDTSASAASMPYQVSTPIELAAIEETDDPAKPTAEEETKEAKVAETGMNGAQVTALLGIIEKVKSGSITLTAAPVVMQSAFPLLDEAKIADMLPKPDEIAPAPSSPALNKAGIAGSSSALPCKTHGAEISNKSDPSEAEALERILAPISGIAADPINEALSVIEKGGSEDEALAAYDAAAAAVLTPDKIAAGADELARILEDAARQEKEAE